MQVTPMFVQQEQWYNEPIANKVAEEVERLR